MDDLERLCEEKKVRLITYTNSDGLPYMSLQDVSEGLGGDSVGLGNVDPASFMDQDLAT